MGGLQPGGPSERLIPEFRRAHRLNAWILAVAAATLVTAVATLIVTLVR